MKTSAWLVIELDRHGDPYIVKTRKRRPRNEMAIRITLDIDMSVMQPRIEALIDQQAEISMLVEPDPDGPIE